MPNKLFEWTGRRCAFSTPIDLCLPLKSSARQISRRAPCIWQASVAPVHWGEAGSPMTAAPSTTTSTSNSIPIDPRNSAIAAGIATAIPEAQVCLFGSRARGTSRPDSDVDLLITVPDHWLTGHNRIRVLGELWRQYSSHRLPLDLLLYTESEVSQRQ
jgi:predicted nucleotidyltransferase